MTAALLSILIHGLVGVAFYRFFSDWKVARFEAPVSVHFLEGDELTELLSDGLPPDVVSTPVEPEEEPKPEEPEPEKPPLPDGQIVEIPKPNEEKVPLQSDYLAEHNNAVPEESRTRQYKVNPDVLSDEYSKESKLALENVPDVGATQVSTGASVGGPNDLADGKGAPRSPIPSMFALTNKEGLAAPTVGSTSTQSVAGAPQNDLLAERMGDRVALNTRELIGADYLNRIRRQVNHYWEQNIENLPPMRLARSSYQTVLEVVLTSDGAIESMKISHESGSEPIDRCLVDAFRIAAPFPNPPQQLIAKDGRVYLPDFDFTVQFSQAALPYQGVDPRAGVQFPGILKNPR